MTNALTERVATPDTEHGHPRGIHTSEFWLTVLGVLCILTLALVSDLEAQYAAATITGATGLYGVSRGLAKRG